MMKNRFPYEPAALIEVAPGRLGTHRRLDDIVEQPMAGPPVYATSA